MTTSPSVSLAIALQCARLAEQLAAFAEARGDTRLAEHWRTQAEAERIGVQIAARAA